MRICAFEHCSNSTYTLERWRQAYCDIHKCRHMHNDCQCLEPFVLFAFPSDKTDAYSRAVWTRLVNRKVTQDKIWSPQNYDRICSTHFKDGKPTPENPYPSENLGAYTVDPPKARKPPSKRGNIEAKKQRLHSSSSPIETTTLDHVTAFDVHQEHAYCSTCSSDKCFQIKSSLQELIQKYEELTERPDKETSDRSTCVPKSLMMKYIEADQKVKMYTGLVTQKAFLDLVEMLRGKASIMRYWSGSQHERRKEKVSKPNKSGPSRKLSLEEELLMTLMKLRLGVINGMLADMFGVSNSTVSQIINTWIKFLARELRPLILWPSKEAILSSFPHSLPGKYRKLRCTIDCTEIFIEKPRNLELQALTWSDYKHHNTIKFLVGIAPNGSVSFLSKAWGGRASDQLITRSSGFYDLLEYGDLILADRGFNIREDLLQKFCTLEIPPPGSGIAQMSGPDVMKTKDIANARIHVERAIGQMKQFSILTTTLPITMVPLIEDITIVCAALSNLLPPLVD